jgi:hypothetical protein
MQELSAISPEDSNPEDSELREMILRLHPESGEM